MCFAAAAAIGPILSAIGSVAGAMVSAQGAQQQADAQAQQAQYQAAVARNNATAEAYAAVSKAQATQEKGDYALAKQRTAFAAAGTSIATGTPVTVFGESAEKVAGDVDTQQYAGRINSQRWQDQATLHDMEAVNAKKAGKIAATSAIIGGISGIGKLFGGGGSSGSSLSLFG